MATTLAQLRALCQQESDNVNQSFVTDAEWNSYINRSYLELYGLVVQAYGDDYYTQSPSTGYTFTTDGTNQFFALPTDFFKLLGVDVRTTSPQQWVPLRPFNFAERNDLQTANGNTPAAGQTLRVFYVPKATALSVDADTVEGVNGWEEYIVVDACIKALAKEESDVSVFLARKQMLIDRLNSEVENRDANGPLRVTDVTGQRALGLRYRVNGNNLWLIGGTTPGWWPMGDWWMSDGWGTW